MKNPGRYLALAGLMLAPVAGLFGQEYRATLLGGVTDGSGGSVAAARVIATNIATGVSTATSTNGEGNYTIPFLQPGQYRLRAEASGFKASEQGPIELRVNDRLRFDVKLELGALTETVVVTAETPLLDVMSASAGQVVDKERIEELPFAKGVPYHLIALSPGLTRRGGAIEENPYDFSIANYAVGGSADNSAIALDGVITGGLIGGSAAPSFSPPQETVEEFRVQTTSFDATQGFTQAANVNVSFKSGTNTPHGAFYYALSRPEFTANTFFNTVHGIAKPDATYSRVGGSFGGPVTIPRVYSGKNRTFFFVGPEMIRLHQIYGRTYTVPTAKERMGDFSELLALGSQYQIYDPATRRAAANGRFVSDPFAGNIIPAARISTIAANLLRNYPLPNLNTPAGVNNYASPTDGKREWYWAGLVRIDHNISERQRVFFSAHHFHRNNEDAPCFEEAQNSAGCGLSWNVNPSGAAFDDVYTFGPSLIMDFHAGYERYTRVVDYLPGNQQWSYAANGFPAYLDSFTPATLRRMPGFSPSGYSGLPTYSDLRWDESDIRSLALSFTKTAGAHTLRFGWEGRSYLKNSNAPGKNTTGSFVFGTDWTQGPNDNSPAAPIGQGLASMLLGLPTGGGIDRTPSAADSSVASGLFIQEDWRVTRRLSLNLGLRYEYESPTMERYNRSVRGFDFQATLPIAAQVMANYASNPTPEIPPAQFRVQGGLQFAGVGGQPRQLWNPDTNNLLPRFGIAYSVNQNTVLRGGYGIYFGNGGDRYSSSNQTGFSFTNTLVPSLDGGLSFIATLANPFPNGIIQTPPGAGQGPMTFAGKSISFFNPDRVTPYIQRWQFGVQHQLPARVRLDVSYAGNRATKLDTTRNLNALPLQYLSTSPVRDAATINYLSTNLSNPFYPLLPGTNLAGTLVARSQLLLPYPQFTGVNENTNEGYSWYHSLQASVERRMANGFTAQLAYTWSKWMQATTFLNAADPRPERVISNLDFPHTVTVSGIYELPVGTGRRFLGNRSRFVDYILGRWQLEGVYRYQSGAALGFGNAIILDGSNIALPSDQRSISQWFNVNAFVRASAAQLSSNRVTLSSRFSGIRSDALNQMDLSALKKFKVHERFDIEVRAEFLNAFNSVYLSTPNTTPSSSAFGTVTGENGAPRNVNLHLRARF